MAGSALVLIVLCGLLVLCHVGAGLAHYFLQLPCAAAAMASRTLLVRNAINFLTISTAVAMRQCLDVHQLAARHADSIRTAGPAPGV